VHIVERNKGEETKSSAMEENGCVKRSCAGRGRVHLIGKTHQWELMKKERNS